MPDDCRCDVTQVGGSGLYDIETYEPSCPVHGDPNYSRDDMKEVAPHGGCIR